MFEASITNKKASDYLKGNTNKWEWNIKKNKISRSGSLLTLLDCSEEEIGFTFDSFLKRIHSDDVNEVRKVVARTIENKTSYKLEYRFITPAGRELIVHDQAHTILDEFGEVEGLSGVIKDITLRRKADKALWKTEYKLAVAHKIARLVSWEYEPSTNRITWSEGIHELLGSEPRTIEQFRSYIHPNDLDFVKRIGEASNFGEPYNIEYRLIKQDGTQINVYEQAEVFFNSDGKIERKIGTLQDITERKKTEERLLNSEKLSVVGQLAAGVAHEIRNPLTSLRGFIQLLDGGISSKEYYKIMLDELDRIEFIVSEFLNLAKPQSTNFENYNPVELLQGVISLLKTEANLQNITIELDIKKEVQEIYCEKNQIKQVYINMFKNAMDAMPKGGVIKVTVDVMPCNYLLIQFKDEGVGIPKERLKKIGEPFYSTKEKGTGLGIMICDRIIARHGGEISFESEENVGTTVSISIPIK
ncbi:PAS domain-containing protein [Lottiidibacillus patelloidae]|uniref:PAS domain-containing protein n=1 Tax=Lottiidibacillus patelloidae TaxID=2670334 RepID=UPI001302F214|nr:PAS domain-containing protein [Lottiidibacillus patelloidae]